MKNYLMRCIQKTICRGIIACMIVCICSCNNKNEETQRQIRDKRWIEQSIIDNIEAERLAEQDSVITAVFDSISRPISYGSIYSKYAIRRLKESHKWKFYPQKASEQVDAIVDKIFYSEDSLKCAATIVVYQHYDISPEFEDPNENYSYNAFAVLGVRDSINKPFKTYPLLAVLVSGYSYKRVAVYINSVYNTNVIRKCSTPGSYMEKRKNEYKFSDKNFFIDSPDFQTDSVGNYWGEYYYQPVTKPVRVYFYSNRDDASNSPNWQYDVDNK